MDDYEPNLVATELKVLLALVPIDWMAVKQTTTISASITAYSHAEGPNAGLHLKPYVIFFPYQREA